MKDTKIVTSHAHEIAYEFFKIFILEIPEKSSWVVNAIATCESYDEFIKRLSESKEKKLTKDALDKTYSRYLQIAKSGILLGQNMK